METIAVVGMRCAGKTTVGRLLASRMNIDFIDTDDVVEQMMGESIYDLIQQGREAEFRLVEETVCLDALRKGGVVALGGGSITSDDVRRALWSVMTVFLDASDSLIASRLKHEVRPSLTGQAPWLEAAGISKMRRPWYLDVADFVIHVDGKEPEIVCREIVALVGGFSSPAR